MERITKDWFNGLTEEDQRGHINMLQEMLDFDQKACNQAFRAGNFRTADSLAKAVNYCIFQKNQFIRLFNENKS